jgi:hypothetical protein
MAYAFNPSRLSAWALKWRDFFLAGYSGKDLKYKRSFAITAELHLKLQPFECRNSTFPPTNFLQNTAAPFILTRNYTEYSRENALERKGTKAFRSRNEFQN